jgi:LmbE family N-acetylglucosaminyl deacetylase
MSSEVMTPTSCRRDVLPAWTTVLAVVAHPDDESFGLGALLDGFTGAGASVEVLCLTHGEASTLHGPPETSPPYAVQSWLRPPTCSA